MDEEQKQAYQERFQARIEEWEARLQQLRARAKRAEADLRMTLNDEESELRKRLDEARRRLAELRNASGDGWEEIKGGAEKLFTDVRAAWERSAAPRDEAERRDPGATGAAGGPGEGPDATEPERETGPGEAPPPAG